ncbi:NEDD4-binding protein 3 isoform X2 [Ambystoma mexicanum]|uniref:NEDD4-binding protein 3 isoform X2 n=1 Tax=Ambystoma mexicanum TaxID=8296 RepID=UPI0037E810DD
MQLLRTEPGANMSRIEPSSFKPIGVKNFFSMESLSPSGGAKLSQSQNSLNATVPRGPLRATHLHTINQDEREEEGDSLTDSGPCSVNSVPCYTPATGPPRSPLSASTGHINHIGGSLDRATRGRSEQAQCRSMAVLNRLYSAGDPPPPYECPGSLEDVLQKMEEQLQQKGVEARPLQRSPNGNKYPFAQVCEDKRRLWLEELDELKQMYVLKLQQVSQQALRSQRILQLQLYKVQQEKKRLQEELTLLRTECEELKQRQLSPAGHNPKLEESKWEVSQKAGEISLLRKQLQDSQSALAQKAGEVFSLKTQLKEARAHEKEVTGTEEHLWTQEHPKCLVKEVGPGPNEPLRALQHPVCHGLVSDTPPAFSSCETDDSKCLGLQGECSLPAEALVEHLQAALRLERRQSEALLGAFETERRTWKQEKERVLKYQREIQTGYTEMYQRSQALERELQDLKRLRQDSKTPTSLWIGQADSSDT